MTDVLKIFFEGREELMRVIQSNEPIIKYLSNVDNPVCPLLGSEIKFVKELGKGKMGVVFEIDFPDRGTRRYVAKKAQVPIMSFVIEPAPRSGRQPVTFQDLQEKHGIFSKVIIEYNQLSANPTDAITQDVIIPIFKKGCILRKDLTLPKLSGTGIVKFQPKDKICETTYTEFMIALLVGELYRSGTSINFLDTFYFATCIEGHRLRNVQQYTFMEQIDRSLKNTIGCITEIDRKGDKNPNYRPEVVESILIQILHAISEYQENYKIVHGDLHDDNVFLEYVRDTTTWNGELVLEADYYQYKVKGTDLYVLGGRECPFIVKIGDWGIACKYSTPRIIETTVGHTGYDQMDGNGPWLPNFYTTAYDVLYIINILDDLNPSNEFIQGILAWIYKLPAGSSIADLHTAHNKIFNAGTGRPKLDLLETSLSHVSALAILSNKDLMGKYMQTPTTGKSILFGKI